MRSGLFIIGVIALLVGLVWIGQGTGIFPYPRSSFMINEVQWAYYGAATAIVGLLLMVYARRL
jgi:hypothetical protein